MSNTIKYNGYHATIEFSAEDELLVGSVIGILDSLNFHGSSIEEVTRSFHDCIDGYLEMCKSLGRQPDKEYKGSLNIRIGQELHRLAALEAEKQGIKLNKFIQNAIENQLKSGRYKEHAVFSLPAIQQYLQLQADPHGFTKSRYSKTPSAPLSQ